MKDLRQYQKYSDYIRKLGWESDLFNGVYVYSRKFLFWRFVKVQRPDKLSVNLLISYLEKKYKYSTVYVEPINNEQYEELLGFGFKKYNSPFLPSKTIQMNLTKSEEQLLKEMHYKTRYNCNKVSSIKYQVSRTEDVEKFADFWQRCAKDRGMYLSQKKEIKAIFDAFGKDAMIHIATYGGANEWLAGVLRISTIDISYYMYAASTDEGKKLFAPTILAWDALRSAKKEGKKIFDFEGIYDERFPLKSWKGFSRFKKSFGGREVDFPGTLYKVII